MGTTEVYRGIMVAREGGVVAAASGGGQVFALREDGWVEGWGNNTFNQVAGRVEDVLEGVKVFGGDVEGEEGEGEGKGEGEARAEEGARRGRKKIVGIGCAWAVSWVITEDRSLYIFGRMASHLLSENYFLESGTENGPVCRAPYKVRLPRSLRKEQAWRAVFGWMFLGGKSEGSVLQNLPEEVIYHLVGLLM
jgi:hypothetical protein